MPCATELLDQAIRENKQPSCNIDQAFEEGIALGMAIMAQKEGTAMFWDKDKEEVVRG